MPRNKEIFINNLTPEQLTSTTTIQRPIGVDLFYSDLPEAQTRRTLSDQVRNLFDQVPDVHLDFDQALDQRLINQNEVAEFYHHLSDFISSDPNHSRLILYLPFQILPNSNHSQNRSAQLIESQHKFTQTYKNAWIQQLFDSDLRADFVDGDVLEPGLGKPPLVRKAAHLLPELLSRGLVQKSLVEEIITLNIGDSELISSLQDGLNVVIKSDSRIVDLHTDLAQIEQKYGLDSPDVSSQSLKEKYSRDVVPDTKISRQRANWKRKLEREELFNLASSQICDSETIDSLFMVNSSDPAYKIIGLKTIFHQNLKTEKYESLIKKYWHSDNSALKNTILSGLYQWQKKGLVSPNYLNQFGLIAPDLSAPFPACLDHLVSHDFKNLSEAVKKIKNDPTLSQNFYPFFLAFGSRVKGYATPDSDQDIAIFFKPNAPFEKRADLLQLIRTLPELAYIDKLAEIWTSEKDGDICFRSMSQKDWTIVEPQQIHFLLGGVWIGDFSSSPKIRQDFLQKYLDLNRFGSQKDQVRFQFLRQLENDVLQCRLMHKGYRSIYPNQKPERFSNMSSIDGHSDFWDPGYRRIATQLFLSRVFLPDLSK